MPIQSDLTGECGSRDLIVGDVVDLELPVWSAQHEIGLASCAVNSAIVPKWEPVCGIGKGTLHLTPRYLLLWQGGPDYDQPYYSSFGASQD